MNNNLNDKIDRSLGLIVKYQVFWTTNNNIRIMECNTYEECLKEISRRQHWWIDILKRDITPELEIKRMVFKPEDLIPKI